MSANSDFFGWQLLQDQLSNDANFTIDLAKEIGKTYCRIQQKYPVRNRLITNPMGLPIIDFCNQAGIPPALPVPPPPFTGGQCSGTLYRVIVSLEYGNAFDLEARDFQEKQVTGSLPGKVTDVSFQLQQNDSVVITTVVFDNGNSTTAASWNLGRNARIHEDSIKAKVLTQDGSADACGDPPPDYPPDPEPQPEDFAPTFNYSYETNTGDTITNEYTINYDQQGGDFYFPVVGFIADVDFNADIDFDLDLGGITINRRGGGGGGGGGGTSNYNDNLPAPNEDNSEETETDNEEKIFIKQPKPPEEESQDTGLERLDYITIDIIQKPSNAPRQDGTPGDDIYFPGFAEFKSGGYNYPRIPLHFERNILRAPDGADGYAVRFYSGYKGQITVYTRKETS